MTWTYGNDPGLSGSSQRRDYVRLLTGDNVAGQDVTLSDEEIAAFLLPYPSTNAAAVYLASARAALSLSGRWAAQADSLAIGKTRIEYAGNAARLRTLSADLRRDAALGVNAISVQGISVAANLSAAQSNNTVQPQAYTGRDAYPGTTPPLSTQTQEGA